VAHFQMAALDILGVLSLVLILLALVTAIVATEPGSRWALNQASDRLPLELVGVRGNLITGLDIDELEYRMEDQHYRVEGLSFRWQSLALLYSTVSVQSLSADSVALHLPPPAEEDPEAETDAPIDWPNITLPVSIELGDLDIRNIRVFRGELAEEIDRLSGTINVGTSTLRVWNLKVAGPDYEVAISGHTSLLYPYDSKLNIDWQYELRELLDEPLPLAGKAELAGDLNSVTLKHQLKAPLELRSELRFWPNLEDPDATPQLVMDNSWPEQSVPPFLLPEDIPALRTAGRLQLEGWLDDYHLELSGDALAQDLPELAFTLIGRGDLEHMDFEQLSLVLPEGQISSEGLVRWAPELQWNLSAELQDFNPASLPFEFLADWPGQIGGGLRSEGKLAESGLQLTLDDLSLSGELRELPLSARGGLSYEGERLLTRDFALALGDNTLTINGAIAEHFDVRGELIAPDLAQLDPSLSGAIEARLAIRGSRAEPNGQIKLEGTDLRWEDYSVAQLSLDFEQERGLDGHYALNLDSRDWQLAGQILERFQLSGDGSPEAHQVDAELDAGELGQLSLRLEGGYVDESWQGHIAELWLAPPDPLEWRLEQPAALSLAADAASLDSLCLAPGYPWRQRARGGDDEDAAQQSESSNGDPEDTDTTRRSRRSERDSGRLCLSGQWDPQAGASAQASIVDLPLRLAQRWLQPEVELIGSLGGDLALEWDPQTGPVAQWQLRTRDGAIHYQFDENDVDMYQWSDAIFTGNWRDDQLSSVLNLDWADIGHAHAVFGMNMQSGELSGALDARFAQMAVLEAFVPRLQEVGGELSAQLELQGTLEQPDLRGSVRLSEGTAKIPELGLHLQNLGLTAQADTDRIELSGEVTSEPGTLTLSGEILDPWSDDRRISARLTGEEFLAVNTRELLVHFSPDLTLDLQDNVMRLEGDARIPKALARFSSIPETATRRSDDVVVRDPDGEAEPGLAGMEVRVDLNVILGDDVRFEGFGLESRLSGQLQVIQTPERGLLTVGEVGIAEGKYKAYGQDLNIERGRLIFQGPQDNPGLDIRAVREADGITAGLEIEGTLQRPRSRVFSTPAMSDSDAMSVLLTGRPLGSGSAADASMLVNAVGNLGLERSGFITAEIADTFGLDEFRIQTEDQLTESSLHIGKYITPRLFVRYVVGLFDQTNRVGMRYELTEGLRLEAESGIHQSVDLIYNFER